MKMKLAAVALFCCVAMLCSETQADLLGRLCGRGECGGCDTATSCCDTPAPACGGQDIGSCCDDVGRSCRLFNRCGGGCGLFKGRNNDCDCEEVVMDNACGCEDPCSGGCKLGNCFARLRGRLSSIGNRNDCGCGCEAPVETCGDGCGSSCCDPMAGGLLGHLRAKRSACGCETTDCCDSGRGCNLGSRLHGMFARKQSMDCGCAEPAPAMDCCDSGRGCGCNLFSKLGSRRNSGCCDSCGSTGGCGCNLFGKLKGRRNACDTCNSCGNSGCGCATSATIGDMAPQMAPEVAPVPAPAGDAVEVQPVPATDGAFLRRRRPILDPSAFVIRN